MSTGANIGYIFEGTGSQLIQILLLFIRDYINL